MSNPKWTIGLIFLFVVFTVLSSIVEGATLDVGMTKLEVLFDLNWGLLLPWNAVGYLGNIVGMFLFQYAFLDGMPYCLVRYLLFWPISAGMIISMVIRRLGG